MTDRAREDFFEYADALEEVFGLRGWKLIVEEAENQIRINQMAALDAKSWEDVVRLQGETAQLVRIVTLADTIRALAANAREEEDEESFGA